MESALDVLSRAATMVQDNGNETRLTSKELPTSTWRRERRLRTCEYHLDNHLSSCSSANSARACSPIYSPPQASLIEHSPISTVPVSNTNTPIQSNAQKISLMMATAATASMHPLGEPISRPSPTAHSTLTGQIHLSQIAHSPVLQHINLVQSDDAPLDMSVGNLKQRNSPPPYREPLPGLQYTSSLDRPSVITQAPPKRDIRDSTVVANRENDNRSCESIDEHFRRSLGNDYYVLFSKSCTSSHSTKTPSPQPQKSQPQIVLVRSPSPIIPLSSQSALTQSVVTSPPTYSESFPTGSHEQSLQKAHQNPLLAILSPATTAAQMKITKELNSPSLPLAVRSSSQPKRTQPVGIQKSSSLVAITPLTSPQSPASIQAVNLGPTTQTLIYSTTDSPSPVHQQLSTVAGSLSDIGSVDHSPSSSPRCTPPVVSVPVSNHLPNLPAIMRIKMEPVLQNVKSHNPTPPASPTSCTIHNINSINSANAASPSPSSPITSSWKSTKSGNTSAEVLASVDDHFAKALGDTWKKLQENKEIRK